MGGRTVVDRAKSGRNTRGWWGYPDVKPTGNVWINGRALSDLYFLLSLPSHPMHQPVVGPALKYCQALTTLDHLLLPPDSTALGLVSLPPGLH